MSRRILPLAVLVSCAALLAWWAWPRLKSDLVPADVAEPARAAGAIGDVEVADAATTPPAAAGDTPLAAPPAADAAAATAPLDPALPLRDTIADLERRARGGEAVAACLLGAELLRCERARNMQPYVDNIESQMRHHARASAKPEDIDRGIDQALRRQAENAEILAHCEGVDPAAHAPPARWFGIAAQAGHRPSMVRFLGAELYRPDQLFRDPGLIALYRTQAPRHFATLLEAGDVEFLQRWTMAAGLPNDILFDVLPPPYDQRGLGTAMMDRYLRARGIKPPEVMRPFPATPEQIELAGEIFERHFAQVQGERLPERMAPGLYDLAQYRCEDGAR